MALLPVFDAARTFNSGSLTASYQDVGAAMGSPVIGLIIYNDSDVHVQFSFDDGTSNGPIVTDGQVFRVFRSDYLPRRESGGYVLPEGAQIQIKQVTASGSGNIVVNVIRE